MKGCFEMAQTEGEKRVKKAFDKAGIKYKMGVRVGPYEVDFLVDDIAVEVDGYSHLLPEKMQIDKRKETYLFEKGYDLIRILSDQTKDAAFMKKLLKRLDNPVYINHNEPITHKPFLSLEKLKGKMEEEKVKKTKTGKEEMLDWLNKHASEIPASKDEED